MKLLLGHSEDGGQMTTYRFDPHGRFSSTLSQGETLALLEMVKAELPQLPSGPAPESKCDIVGASEIVSTLRSVAEEGDRKFHERVPMSEEERKDREEQLQRQLALAGRLAEAESHGN
jgi:hypothetical protein